MPLVYTTQRPTKPGWYWIRYTMWGTQYEGVNEVIQLQKGLAIRGNDYVNNFHGLWAGPIDKPMTANEYHLGGYIT